MYKAKLIPLIAIVLISIVFAQDPTFEREIIVMFKPNVVELPQGRVEAQLSEVTIAVSRLKAVLERINMEVIEKAFPEFKLADTLGVARTGEIVKLADLSNIYKIRLPERQNTSEAVAEMIAFPEVIYAEPNSIAVPHAVYPNDDYFDNPNNPGQGGYQWGPTGSQICAIASINIMPDSYGTPLENEIFSLDTETGIILQRLTRNIIDEGSFRLSPDGKVVAFKRGKYGQANSFLSFRCTMVN